MRDNFCLLTFVFFAGLVLVAWVSIDAALGFGRWLFLSAGWIVLFFALVSANTPPAVPSEPLKPGDVLKVTMDCDLGRRKMRFREGDEVTLWHRPDTAMVYAFLPGTTGGDGRVGTAHNARLCAMVDAGLRYTATVVDASMARDGSVDVRVIVEPIVVES